MIGLAVFVALVVGTGFTIGYVNVTRRPVRRSQQAVVQPGELDLRAGLGRDLRSDRGRWVADMGN
jgi:hypothetical protein